MSNQKRMDEIASLFGDSGKITISLGREKIYPDKEVSDATVERLENALRSPQLEKGTLRVLESTSVANKAELIYRSSQNAVDFDPKNIAAQLQANFQAQAPKIEQVEQSQIALQSFDKEQSRVIEQVNFDQEPSRTTEQVEQSQTTLQNLDREPGGAIVKACQDKEIIPFPINPTPLELDATMPKIVESKELNERENLEQALAAANARIDALQAQLKDTQKSLQELSQVVRNDNLKTWAEHKVQEVAKTSQSVAQQAKSKVMQWVQTKTIQVKYAVHQKVTEVKTAAQDKVDEVKTVAQDKVNEVKTAAQDKVNEVKTAALLKGIEFKESIREQANKFLAPVNSAQIEEAAKHVVREYGDGKNYSKAATHSFHLNDKNELSVTRQADGAVIYQQGELTKSASSHDILKLNALPNIVNQIKATQMQSQQKQQVEVGG